MSRIRLDLMLEQRGLMPSRARARDAILRGTVRVNGEPLLACHAWRTILESNPTQWAGIAMSASASLTPDQILHDLIPDGRTTLRFAERLYQGPAVASTRRAFLEVAARRLPGDRDIDPAERSCLEARVAAALDRHDLAVERMAAALALQPENFPWRRELVTWLLDWGRVEAAHEQAQIGFYHASASLEARQTLEITAEALARRGPSR